MIEVTITCITGWKMKFMQVWNFLMLERMCCWVMRFMYGIFFFFFFSPFHSHLETQLFIDCTEDVWVYYLVMGIVSLWFKGTFWSNILDPCLLFLMNQMSTLTSLLPYHALILLSFLLILLREFILILKHFGIRLLNAIWHLMHRVEIIRFDTLCRKELVALTIPLTPHVSIIHNRCHLIKSYFVANNLFILNWKIY